MTTSITVPFFGFNLLLIIYFFQLCTNLFLQEVSEAANCVSRLLVVFEVLTDLSDSRWTCSYLPDLVLQVFCCTVIFCPCSKGSQKDFGSAFQSFDGRPGGTIIQAHVDLFPFINTHSQRRCDRIEEEHSCGSCLL
ncbi:Formylmethanofuran--tetrahydromethanopterin formyltransferase [Labeo rohita]|uniref:Formylmethanofuran--tetrahydromethanopterin formyltransferase n=1 Tax=Labeo rohita TaxID=84645 RepID=A0ABQ8MIU0_LABRO|nr:Formylmethanofuran--tetrahydromethanopterin formyltransferase [Labeo rohita]